MLFQKRIERIKDLIKSDVNLSHARYYGSKVSKSAPDFTLRYLAEKVPIIQWLPKYDPKWIINDVIAGITIGVLLVPQSLAYAKVANIPGQYGLISSWIPTALYAVMGTSKDLTAGPTAIMALLTGEIVNDFVKEGYTDHAIATAVAFFVGIYSLAVGLFKLGFLLDFIPLPVLTGYVSAAALTIIFGQIPTLFGEKNIGSATGTIIHDFFAKLPETQWQTFLVGWSGVLMLVGCQYVGRRWGKDHKAVWFLSICRNAMVLVLFTGVSYAVNKGRKNPLFPISKTVGSGIKTPSAPETALLGKVAGRAVAVWIAAALEHLAIGRAFGRRHNYVIDQSQELTYIGVANFLGSFFSAMPITGGFSRTAVNSESGVKSPLSGLVTAACVLVSIYKLTDAFYWIPKATLSAIIVTAVWPIVIGPATFLKYWRVSFIDFVASQLSFWVTLFVSVEIGIATAVAFSIVYILLCIAFSQATLVTPENINSMYPVHHGDRPSRIPDGIKVFKINEAILFPNAYRLKAQILDCITTHHTVVAKDPSTTRDQRLWNETGKQNIARLRSVAGTADNLVPLRVLILDITSMNHIDTTGMQMLMDLKSELRDLAGNEVALEFVGIQDPVRLRFERANWELQQWSDTTDSGRVQDGGDLVFEVLQTALAANIDGPNTGKRMAEFSLECTA